MSFLLSMKLWLGWEGRERKLYMLIGLAAFIVMTSGHIKFSFSKINIITFLLVFIAHFFYGYKPSIFMPFFFLHYFIIICLNDKDKIGVLRFITQWYGYLLIPGLIIYILLSIIDLPYFGIQRATEVSWALTNDYGVCKNYIFYMQSTFGDYLTRYNGPFLEPGHVGMMCAFLLFVNQFNFKRKGMWCILTGLLFTLSLAGYVLLFIGYLLHIYYQGKITIKHLICYVLLFFTIYIFGMYYNSGDNILYEKIFSRLEYDEEKGFTGNNRVFGMIDLYYVAMWTDLKTLLWGYPADFMDWLAMRGSRGAGYIMSMCRYGLVGTGLSISFYIIYTIMTKYRKYAICCLIFVLLMFWQRSYPLWSSWIICFTYGIISEIKNNQHLNKKS